VSPQGGPTVGLVNEYWVNSGDCENENDDCEFGQYEGDEWWSLEQAAVGEAFPTGIYMPRGSLRGTVKGEYAYGMRLEVTRHLVGFEGESGDWPDGVYTQIEIHDVSDPYDDSFTVERTEGDEQITIFSLAWADQFGNQYVRSETLDGSGNYTYGDIYFDPNVGKWLIGTYGSDDGWYEGGAEPSRLGVIHMAPMTPSGPAGVALSVAAIGAGTYLTQTGHFIFDVGRWL
jgi:hypothetical protein